MISFFILLASSLKVWEEKSFGQSSVLKVDKNNQKNLVFFAGDLLNSKFKIFSGENNSFSISPNNKQIGFFSNGEKFTLINEKSANSKISVFSLELKDECDNILASTNQSFNVSLSFTNNSDYFIQKNTSFCILHLSSQHVVFSLSMSAKCRSTATINTLIDTYDISPSFSGSYEDASFTKLTINANESDDFLFNMKFESQNTEFDSYTALLDSETLSKKSSVIISREINFTGSNETKLNRFIVRFSDALFSRELLVAYIMFFCTIVTIVVSYYVRDRFCTEKLPDEKELMNNDIDDDSDSDYDQPYPSVSKYVPQYYFSRFSINKQEILSPR